MAPVTESNLGRHELIGLPTSVVCSSNPSQVGISGLVVDETMNTVTIADGVRERVVQKKDACFRFTLHDGSTATIEGSKILGRPVERVRERGS